MAATTAYSPICLSDERVEVRAHDSRRDRFSFSLFAATASDMVVCNRPRSISSAERSPLAPPFQEVLANEVGPQEVSAGGGGP